MSCLRVCAHHRPPPPRPCCQCLPARPRLPAAPPVPPRRVALHPVPVAVGRARVAARGDAAQSHVLPAARRGPSRDGRLRLAPTDGRRRQTGSFRRPPLAVRCRVDSSCAPSVTPSTVLFSQTDSRQRHFYGVHRSSVVWSFAIHHVYTVYRRTLVLSVGVQCA